METNSKRAKVIMLPTATEPYKMPYHEYIPEGIIIKTIMWGLRTQGEVGHIRMNEGQSISNYSKEMYQHLYFTTDEEIKEGDWYVILETLATKHYNRVCRFQNQDMEIEILKNHKEYCRKIVATTDNLVTGTVKTFHDKRGFTEQYLPQPSQAFIEKYCELGGIDEVLVEYEVTFNGKKYLPENRVVQVKTDSHNTVTIHPVKNSWSKEEVMQLIRTFDMTMGRDITTKAFDDWINKNLKV